MKKIRLSSISVFFLLYCGIGLLGQEINIPTENQNDSVVPLMKMVRNIFKNLSLADNKRVETGTIDIIGDDNLIRIITYVFVVLAILTITCFLLYCCGCVKRISLWRQKWFRFE